MLISVLLQQQQ